MNRQKEEIVKAIINTSTGVPRSAEDMETIIAAVDDIAYQTNLLALSLTSKQILQKKSLHVIR